MTEPLPIPGTVGVKVKPLSWRGSNVADCPFGEYTIDLDEDDDVAATPWVAWSPAEDGTNLDHFATRDEARAACQADYEQRILSCLTKVEDERDGDLQDNFWLVLRDVGEVPRRKGPWPRSLLAATLREFIAANPFSYIDVLTMGADGPDVQHGPEALQMADGRSMAAGRRHNVRLHEAEAAAIRSAKGDGP